MKKFLIVLIIALFICSLTGVSVSAEETTGSLSDNNFLVIKDYKDIVPNDHIIFSAFINGVEETIKVNAVYSLNESGEHELNDITLLDSAELSNFADSVFGLYSYTIGTNDYYTITEYAAPLKFADYFNTAKLGVANFSEWQTTWSNVPNQSRKDLIRFNQDTVIYVVSKNDKKVEIITPESNFTINFDTDMTGATFAADRIGYGDQTTLNPTVEKYGIMHGVASFVYFVTDANFTPPTTPATPIGYKIVYIESDLESTNFGTPEDIKFDNGDPNTKYYKYTPDNEAYYLSTFSSINEIYVDESYSKSTNNKLVAGVYFLNQNNIVADHIEISDIQPSNTLKDGELSAKFYVKKIKSSEINLYDYAQIRFDIEDSDLSSLKKTANIQTIIFKFFEYDGEKLSSVNKHDTALLEYLSKNFYDTKSGTEIAAEVLVAGNTYSGFNSETTFPNNTFRGIVYNYVVDTGDNSYIINYNSNGGTGTPQAQITDLGIECTISNKIPSKPGFTFLGWSTSANGEVEFDSGDSYSGNTSITLYAVWGPLFGDVDVDGKVDSIDVIKLARHLATWTGYENINMTNADVDGDGEITVSDSAILARHWAGWIKYQDLPYME